MTRGLVRLSLICSILTCGLTSSADDVLDALEAVEAAEAAFEVATETAKQTLINAYKQEIVKQTESEKLENITRLATGLQFFEADGLLMEPELAKEYKVFGGATKAARDALLESYRVASTKLAASGAVEELQEIQQKIRDRGLVSKLVSLQLTSKTTLYLAHGGYKGLMEDTRTAGLNSTFEMIVGLSTDGIVRESVQKSGIQGKPSEIVSFRSISVPNYYLAHGNNELLLQRYIDADAFRQNASFRIQKGLFRPSAVSFEAVSVPDHYLAMDADGFVRLQKRKATAEFSRAATFTITRPKFPIW
jgi:hypothetical protein